MARRLKNAIIYKYIRKEGINMKNNIKRYFVSRILAINLLIIVILVFLFMRFVLKIYIIDPYYLICALIIFVGLLFMYLASYKELCEYNRGGEHDSK